LISRIQQVADAAEKHGRKMALAGSSMIDNVKIARKLGYLDIPDKVLIPLEQALQMQDHKVVLMCTGSQGEPSSIVGRLSAGTNRQFDLKPNDTVVLSSHPIPGNEELVNRTINRLFQRGANVLYDPIAQVHVSGHASQEEQKLMLNLVRPEYFIPVHGELRHLRAHEALARQVGIAPQNIFVVENGYAVEFDEGEGRIGERVPGGYVYIDGSGVGDVGPAVLREREVLGRDGFVIAILHRDPDTGELVDQPEIMSKGFIHPEDGEDILSGAAEVVMRLSSDASLSDKALQDRIKDKLSEYVYHETKRRPMIIPVLS